MLKNLLIVLLINFITLMGFFIVAVLAHVIIYNDYTYIISGALATLAWNSPIVFFVLLILFMVDFIFCESKNKRWILTETFITTLMFSFIIFSKVFYIGENWFNIFIYWVLLFATVFSLTQLVKYLILIRYIPSEIEETGSKKA